MSQEEIDRIYAQIRESEVLLKKTKADVLQFRRKLKKSTVVYKLNMTRKRK